MYPELQMQQMLQVDLLLSDANYTPLITTWHGAPSQVTNLQKDSPNQRPTKIYKIAAKMYVMTKMPRQHTLRAIKPQFNNIYWCEIKEIE